MKRYLHFYYWLLAIFLSLCGATAADAQVQVTSLSQLKTGVMIKIYPKNSNGTSHYGDSQYALACSGNGQALTSYEYAKSGSEWTLEDAGDGYCYLKNEIGCYWAYQDTESSHSLTCTTSKSSAVKIDFTWDSNYRGVCFWNQRDGKGLNNLYGYNYRFNWYSEKSNYNGDANTTFDVALIKDEGGEYLSKEITNEGIKYLLDLHDKTAVVLANNHSYSGNVVIPDEVTYDNATYKVTSLVDGCFEDCRNLTSITLPNGLTSLGNDCFYGCI